MFWLLLRFALAMLIAIAKEVGKKPQSPLEKCFKQEH
jgi:hypothetical protein